MSLKKLSTMATILMIVTLIVSACGSTPEPQVVEVEKVVTQVVKETVKETVIVEGTPEVVEKEVTSIVEVEKEVEVVATPTPSAVSELRLGMSADIENFDMRKMGSVVSYSLLKHINETLLFFDANSELFPILAESWEQMDDTTMRFYLRQGVTFHDGSPFTAEAVKYSIEKVLDPEFPAWMGFAVDGVIAEVNIVDDYTVDVVTTAPTPSLLWRLTLVDIVLPEYAEKGGQDRHPVGTGPYKFVQYTPRQNFILERNDDYWGDQPGFDRIEARILPEDGTRLAALLAGEVDMINAVSPEMKQQIEGNDGTTTVSGTTSRLVYIALRNDRQPLDNPKVRQALNYAIDRETIVDTILAGIAEVIDAPLPRTLQCARTDLEYPYDPDKATELLEESGYNGEEIIFALPRGRYPNDAQVGEAIVGYWQDVGINVTFEQGDFATIQPQIRQGKDSPFDAAFQGWSADALDPVLMALFLFHSDNTEPRSDYENPEVDALLDEANAQTDMTEVCRLLEEVQGIVWDDAPFVFLYTPVENLGINENLKGFTTHPFEIYWFYDAYLE